MSRSSRLIVAALCAGLLVLAQGCKDVNVTIHNNLCDADSFGVFIHIKDAQTTFPEVRKWYKDREPDRISPRPEMGCGWFLLVWYTPLPRCQEYHVGGTFEEDQNVRAGGQKFWGGEVYYGSVASTSVTCSSPDNLGFTVSNPSDSDTVTVSALQWAVSPVMFDLDSLYWGNHSLDTLDWENVVDSTFQLLPEESRLFDIVEDSLTSGQYALLRSISGNAPPYDLSQAVGQILNDVLLSYCGVNYILLSYFTASPGAEGVALEWETEAEVDNAGFNLFRSIRERGSLLRLNEDLIPAEGSATEGATYVFEDSNIADGSTYYYWLQSIDLRSKSAMHGPIMVVAGPAEGGGESPIDASPRMAQNFPNPFSPMTEIRYDLLVDCHVRLDIFNSLGRKVATLVDEHQEVGIKTVTWDGRSDRGSTAPSGTYFCRLHAGNSIEVKKMALIR